MKQTKTRVLCLLLAALMLLSLTACGKDKTPADPNLLKIGDYTLLYKGAYITEDYDGNDAVVLTLDFTNNSKENASYLWSILETAMQNGVELDVATVYTDFDAFETLMGDQMKEVAPSATLEVRTAFVLDSTTDSVEVTFSQMLGSKSSKITIDPSTLSREGASDRGDDTSEGGIDLTGSAEMGDTLLDWWNGDWYGWWIMTSCAGYYEDMDYMCWDICGTIDIGDDYVGTVTLWDEDYTRDDPMVDAAVSLNEAGTGEHGTLYSEGGRFTNVELAHADWIVDPGLLEYDDLIVIDGWYENGDDSYKYELYLRPWGYLWDDVDEDSLPYYYTSWYLPLIEAGEAMPDSIDTTAANAGSTDVSSGTMGAADDDYGLSNVDATGLATLEAMREAYAFFRDYNNPNRSYEKTREILGSDGIPWKETDIAWTDEHHTYKWKSAEGDFLTVTFRIENGQELYSSSSYSSSVAEGNG